MENFNRDTRKQLVIVVLFPQPWTGALLCRMTELHLEKLLPPSGISSLRLPRDNDLCGIDLKKKKKKRAKGLILEKMQQVNLSKQKM